LLEFASGVAEKNRSRFYLLAERRKNRKRRCGVCVKKYTSLYCCVKSVALRCGMLENSLYRVMFINHRCCKKHQSMP